MEDDLYFFSNGSRPQLVKLVALVKLHLNGRQPQIFQMEDDLNFFQMEGDLYFFQMEDDLYFFSNGI
jgi:hypothetical protein